MNKEINRIRIVLAELNVKYKWLADKLGKNPTTISLWANNERQPSLETLIQIADVLDVDIRDLIISTKLKNKSYD
jgi:putative transcriptional regulator